MVNALVTLLLVVLFFFLGHITQAIKKLLGLVTSLLLKILNLFGITIKKREKHVKVSTDFKLVYKDIKHVNLSKKNIKQQSSIDWASFGVLVVVGLLVVLNMGGNVISNWLFSIQPFPMVKTAVDMNTFYTATLFSVLSFSLNNVLRRWKETKQQRQENKIAKIKAKAIENMDTKELLDEAKKKDEQNRKELE